MNALQPLFPALRFLTAQGLPETFQSWFAYANAQQAERLAGFLVQEFAEVFHSSPDAIDHAYLRSPGFQANVVQAVRAAEVAESDNKLRFIARGLAGCVLAYPPPAVDKFQTMRMLESVSEREFATLLAVVGALDPVDPYADSLSVGTRLPGLSRDEAEAALLGLTQLGLLRLVNGEEAWQLSPLARQVVNLTRLDEERLSFGGLDLF